MDVKNFFKPDKRKLVLFAIFSIVAYFAMIQTWAFCKECSLKPFLYDAIAWFPFWSLWVYISLPIQIMSAFLLRGAFPVLLSLVYFYVVSCFAIYSFEQFRKEFSKKVIAFWIIIFIVLNLYNLVLLPWLVSTSGEQILIAGTQPSILETIGYLTVEVISFGFYAYLISCIFFIAKNKLNANKPRRIHLPNF